MNIQGYFIIFILLLSLFSCNPPTGNLSSELTDEDRQKIRQLNMNYTSGWIDGDSSLVLEIFDEAATIIPSGLNPISGKKAIAEFWFPNDSSITTIHAFDLEILELYGSNDLAYTYERGNLSFSYSKGDFRMDREAESYTLSIYRKNEDQKWKIVKKIWTDMK